MVSCTSSHAYCQQPFLNLIYCRTKHLFYSKILLWNIFYLLCSLSFYVYLLPFYYTPRFQLYLLAVAIPDKYGSIICVCDICREVKVPSFNFARTQRKHVVAYKWFGKATYIVLTSPAASSSMLCDVEVNFLFANRHSLSVRPTKGNRWKKLNHIHASYPFYVLVL